MLKSLKVKKIISIIILFTLLISLINSYKNIKIYDKNYIRSDGITEHHIIRSDIAAIWSIADSIKKKLERGYNLLEIIPAYERYLLPSIIIGYFYYLINEEIIDKDYKNNANSDAKNEEIIFKIENKKFYFLVFQNIIFYLSVLFFSLKLAKKFNQTKTLIIISIICLEPSIFQYQASFWSESIFLSMFLIMLAFLIDPKKTIIKNIILGILLGVMFAQRSIYIGLIFPIIIYYILIFKKKFLPILSLLLGLSIIFIFILINNYNLTKKKFLLSYMHQYYGPYHYYGEKLISKNLNISNSDANLIKNEREEKWKKENNIQTTEKEIFNKNNSTTCCSEVFITDAFKIIKYRNISFITEAIQSPFFTIKFFSWKILQSLIFDPTMVVDHFYIDKSIKNYWEQTTSHQIIYLRILYSFAIYFLSLQGFIIYYKNIKNKKYKNKNKFIFLLILLMLYNIIVSGWIATPRYLITNIICLSFFMSIAINNIVNSYLKLR